jgi:uncharacterized protein (TIGR03067 family)
MRTPLPLLAVVALFASLSLSTNAADAPAFDSRLQGTWQSTGKGEPDRGDRLVIQKDGSLTFRGKEDSESYDGRIQKTDEKASPATLHVEITASSEKEMVGKMVRAIYQIKDGKLELASRGPGREELPKGFEDEEARRFAFTRAAGKSNAD